MRFVSIAMVCTAALLSTACGGGSSGTAAASSSQTAVASPPPAAGASNATYQNESGCLSYSISNINGVAGTDPLFANQWHLRNTGQSGGTAGEDLNVVAAWTTTKGLGARVAVVDDAVETIHPDLAPNVVAGASYNYRKGINNGTAFPFPCSANESHGTAVAGLIAARDGNSVGGSGVAPRVALVGLNPLATNLDVDIGDALVKDGANNLIYNNSWGSPDDGKLHAAEATFKSAINFGIANGRGGKGSIYVFPAGNGGCYAGTVKLDSSCDGFSDNANFDGYTNFMGIIAACAVTDKGRKPWYDETGANVLVCGVSSDRSANVVTTDLTSPSGKSGYRSDFSGTSASTPMVSGVAALMLAVRPELTWRDVRLVLAQSARRNDNSDSAWTSNFGYHYHPSYSFGVVDAQAAVALAQTWTSVGGSSTLQSCVLPARTVNAAITDAPTSTTAGVTVEDTITVSAAACGISKIEFIEVGFAADMARGASGDLRVRLVSPAGLVSELANGRICDGGCGNYGDASGNNPWTFGSTRHLGEAAAGAWKLQVTDMIPQDTGTFRNWSIRFWGR